MVDNSKISIQYSNCDYDMIAEHEASFRDADFRNSLQKCFRSTMEITRIDVIFSYQKGFAHDQYSCSIMIESPFLKSEGSIQVTGNDPAQTMRMGIKKTQEKVYKTKERVYKHN